MDVPSIPVSLISIQQITNSDATIPGIKQDLSFSKGQLLQALVSSKISDTSYELLIDGKKIQANSSIPLKIGQQIDLQVRNTSPQIEFQPVNDKLTSNISSSLNLVSTQKNFFPDLANLLPQTQTIPLSDTSRQTLQFFSQLSSLQGQQTTALNFEKTAGEIFTTILQALNTPSSSNNTTDRLQALIQQLPTSKEAQSQPLQATKEFTSIPMNLIASNQSAQPALSQLQLINQQLQSNNSGNQQLLQLANNILDFFRSNNQLSPSNQLIELLTVTTERLQYNQQSSLPIPEGDQLKQLHERLGLNMEQLFAKNNDQEAVKTLKFALLEIGQQANRQVTEQSNQILQTLELHQMLQARLAAEALFFIPLPLPFIEQGYLVADDPSSSEKKQKKEEGTPTYTLLLQLEGLGNLRVEIRRIDQSLDIRFYTEDTGKMIFLKEHREELDKWITTGQLDSAQFLTGAIEPIKEILAKITKNSSGMVNTKA